MRSDIELAITIKDIAQRVNVSAVTVSNALNGTGRMSEEKRAEIVRVAAELGYIPNRNARNLAKKFNGRIGLFIPGTDYLKGSAFFNSFLSGVLSVLSDNEHDLVLALSDTDKKEIFDNSLDVDGAMVLHPQLSDWFYERLQTYRIPFLLVGRPQPKYESTVSYVDIDNVAVAYNTTKQLLDAGHRSNLIILGNEALTITEDHLLGIRMIYKEYGLSLEGSPILFSDYAVRTEYENVEEILRRYPDITGIVTDSDTQALGILNQLRMLSRRVPEDYSVVCFGGTYQTELCSPPISGASSPSYQVGVAAANKMVDIISRKVIRPSHLIVDYKMFDGKSIAAPRPRPLSGG